VYTLFQGGAIQHICYARSLRADVIPNKIVGLLYVEGCYASLYRREMRPTQSNSDVTELMIYGDENCD
jgi:hypothetical protein